MATEEEKKRNLARLNAMIIYGLEKGLWDLFGESALATTNTVGEGMLAILEKTMGLEIAGEDPQDILTEIGRLFVDEFGIATRFDMEKAGEDVNFTVEHCVLMNVEKDLIEAGIKPFVCPYLNIAAAALRQRLGGKTQISRFEVDTGNSCCHLQFKML
ncbi:MAG: hypothetical protein D6796_14910 [Caldilineae bacterium]|nr:MAG: hypothetical protein D6796_14910 [Caldilineae bacterium]